MRPLNAQTAGTMDSGGYSFSLRDRLMRALWSVTWALLASWTPPPLHKWRCFLLRRFGARIGKGVRIYGSARIWYPANLMMDDLSWLGPEVRCYNQGEITIGRRTVVSQGAYLCASSHDPEDPYFQLLLKPIVIGADVWIASDAFVGPGVTIGDGAVLAARGVAVRSLEPWAIYGGNPARLIKQRVLREI